MLEEAAAAYREASNADPTDTDALIHLGHLLLREGRRAAARATFCEALRRDSSNSEAATALKGLHETDETEKLLQLAYSIEQEAKTLD
jgi:Flp pilus assembly protein TadD